MFNTLVPWTSRNPRSLVDFERNMDELMDRFFGKDRETSSDGFAPNLNVAETDNAFEVTVDLPGMKPEEFNVEFHDGHLWVTGERKSESEETGKTFHRIERRWGTFRRVIPMTNVDAAGITADYKDGILHITANKTEAAKPKRIEVKT